MRTTRALRRAIRALLRVAISAVRYAGKHASAMPPEAQRHLACSLSFLERTLQDCRETAWSSER